ncbi:hypothetical protein [Streptomyces cinereoruber]|uniref:hypothetical protein n=1 Tax=Streptomyces cinereoruber TaxID=67260 RepID=UPI00362F5872
MGSEDISSMAHRGTIYMPFSENGPLEMQQSTQLDRPTRPQITWDDAVVIKDEEPKQEPAAVSLTKAAPDARNRKQIAIRLAVGGAIAGIAAAALLIWAPWVDRTPFTAYKLGLSAPENSTPGSTPNSCVGNASSGSETVVYSEDGTWLAAGHAEMEGEVLGPEFGDWAGYCMILTRIENVPGGHGTYVLQWAGGTRYEDTEEHLRLSLEEGKEQVKRDKMPTG